MRGKQDCVSNGDESCKMFLQAAGVTAITRDTPGQTRVCQCAVASNVASVRERRTLPSDEPVWYHVRFCFHIMQIVPLLSIEVERGKLSERSGRGRTTLWDHQLST
jgi:hypothetical protein